MPTTGPYRRSMAAIGLLTLALTGCRGAIPVRCVDAPRIADAPRSSEEPINFLRLRQDPPLVYLLGPGDILGIYIERILGSPDVPPPVHFSEDSKLPPAIGYPTPIREDGTISLPLVPPIHAEGLTLPQVERLIHAAYTIDKPLLPPGQGRIMVTLIQERTYHVLVIREDRGNQLEIRRQGDIGGDLILGGGSKGEAYALELPAYQNDVLHALSESGGLPGIDAKNEVTILRGAFDDADTIEPYIRANINDPNSPLTPEGLGEVLTPNPTVTKIPLRVGPSTPPVELTQDEIILNDGDVVFIESRDAEVFYTGGLLEGGQFPIPRDYDLDVLGGIAMSGGSIAAAAGGYGPNGLGGSGVGSIFPPTRVIVVRQLEGGQQVTIRLCLTRALSDPTQRILIMPNDLILLEYTPIELVLNILLNNMTFSLESLWD